MFKCIICPDKSYSSRKALNKHDRLVHNIFKEVYCYKCEYVNCSERFRSKRELLRHRAGHKIQQKNSCAKFECKTCCKFYLTNSSLRKHMKHKHKTIPLDDQQLSADNSYECYQCGSIFIRKTDIISHMRIHKNKKCCRRLSCPVEDCEQIFMRYNSLRDHISDFHNVLLKQEIYDFESKAEFDTWKSEIEYELKANYVMDTSGKRLKNGAYRTYYECHRSLAPRLVENPRRNSKAMGTNKISGACPSTLVVTYNGEEHVSAVLYPIHVGHCHELRRLRIDETERHKIAGKLSRGVTVDRVLQDIRESVPNGQLERIHLLEKKDINNIIRDFSIGYSTKRHKNDAVIVKLLENIPEDDVKNIAENQWHLLSSTDSDLIYIVDDPSVTDSESDYELQEDLIAMPSCNNNKDYLNSKFQVIIGLNETFNVSDSDRCLITKHLDKIIDIYKSKDFQVQNSKIKKKIEPQMRMFATKTKRKLLDDPHIFESKMIKLELNDPNSKILNIHTEFDHSYVKL